MGERTMQESVERYGHWAHAGDVEAMAEEWRDEGFAPADVAQWLDARCWNPLAARDLRAECVTPQMAATKVGERIGIGGRADTIGYKLSNGDIGLELAVYLAKENE